MPEYRGEDTILDKFAVVVMLVILGLFGCLAVVVALGILKTVGMLLIDGICGLFGAPPPF